MAPRLLADSVDALLEVSVVGSFTKIGPALRGRLDDWDELPRLDGRRVVVTGATSGLGKATAIRLARLGAEVEVVGRDLDRTTSARDEIAAAAETEAITVGIADLSDLAAARDWARGYASRVDDLHAIVHNAGALDNEYTTGPSGVEITVATHVIAPFLMTAELLGPLSAGQRPGRVLTMTSGGGYTQGLDVGRLELRPDRYDGLVAYARAKRAQMALAEAWADRVDPAAIVFHTTHPGWADTPGVSASLPGFGKVMGPLLRSAEQGADTMVWLVAAEEPATTSGRLWLDRRPRSTRRIPGRDHTPQQRDELWEHCVAEVSRLADVTVDLGRVATD